MYKGKFLLVLALALFFLLTAPALAQDSCEIAIDASSDHKHLVDISGYSGESEYCGPNEVICGFQNSPYRIEAIDKFWCCPISGVTIGPHEGPFDSGTDGGTRSTG